MSDTDDTVFDDGPLPEPDEDAPLETDPADWQEQLTEVPEREADEHR